MKRFSLFALSVVFAGISAVSAFGQASVPVQSGPFKMAVIDSELFAAPTGGITRFAAALKALDEEFRPLRTEIQGMLTRHTALGNEIKKLQDQAAAGTVPIDQKTAATKVEEYQNLELAIKRKEEDGKARAARRQPQVLGPIQREIGNALQDYAKQKGYAMILDSGKLAEGGFILAYGDDTKVDVTKDFITFFNARPASTATTTTPR